MRINVTHLHSANDLYLMSDLSFPRFEMIKSKEVVSMSEKQIGLLLPSTALNMRGAIFVGGEVRPDWVGHILIELHVWKPVLIKKDDIVAHLWVFEDSDPIKFEEAPL